MNWTHSDHRAAKTANADAEEKRHSLAWPCANRDDRDNRLPIVTTVTIVTASPDEMQFLRERIITIPVIPL